MSRKYVDYVIPESPHSLTEMLEVGGLLGFSQYWIDYSRINREVQNQSIVNRIEIIPRFNIDQPDGSKDSFISILRKERRKIPIIAIKCYDSEITSWAAQDNRIDIINFPLSLIGRLFTRSVAKLIIKFSKHLEISLGELYTLPERQQIPILRHIQQALNIAVIKQVPLIFNSGSKTKLDLKAPLDLAALAQFLLPQHINAIDSISSIPFRVTQENLIKTSTDYISPGIYQKNGMSKLKDLDKTLVEEEE